MKNRTQRHPLLRYALVLAILVGSHAVWKLGKSIHSKVVRERAEPPKPWFEYAPPWDLCPYEPYPASFFEYLQQAGHSISSPKPQQLRPLTEGERPLVLVVYDYYERPKMSREYQDNYNIFINYGVFPNSQVVDYLIFSGGPDRTELERVQTINAKNIKYVYHQSRCWAMDNHSMALALAPRPWREYTHFISMNPSVRGPFLLKFMQVDPEYGWLRVFMDRITEDVKMVGINFSCDPTLHVMSMMFMVDRVGMEIIHRSGIYSCERCLACPEQKLRMCHVFDKARVICNCEIGATELFLRHTRYGVDALASNFLYPVYGPLNSQHCQTWSFYPIKDGGGPSNPLDVDGYYDLVPSVFDTIFYKTNFHRHDYVLELSTYLSFFRVPKAWH